MVVDHIGQMIGRVAVRFEQNGVIVHPLDQVQLVGRAILSGFAVYQIVEHRVSFHPQTDHMRLSVGCAFLGFLGGDVGAFPVVAWGQAGLAAMSRESVQSIGGAETSVGMTVVDEIVCVGAVDGSSFGLKVKTFGSE